MGPFADGFLIAGIGEKLSRHAPVEDDNPEARPAAIVIAIKAGANDVEILFIKRAEYESDPWSGQIAFPGGRHEPGDANLFETALRETKEELGVDFRDHSRLLGRLDDLHSRTVQLPNVFVRPFVLAVEASGEFQLSSEVADAFWVPLKVLAASGNWRQTEVTARGSALLVTACHFEGRVIWGMTERILSQLLRVIDEPTQG